MKGPSTRIASVFLTAALWSVPSGAYGSPLGLESTARLESADRSSPAVGARHPSTRPPREAAVARGHAALPTDAPGPSTRPADSDTPGGSAVSRGLEPRPGEAEWAAEPPMDFCVEGGFESQRCSLDIVWPAGCDVTCGGDYYACCSLISGCRCLPRDAY